MALSKKEVAPAKKKDGASAPPPSPKPAAPPAKKKGGRKKGRKGKKGKKKKSKLSPEEERRREVAKFAGVRPQLLAERIAQTKLEMPYFLQVEYDLLADRALAKREREALQRREKAIEEKQQKDRGHMALVTERHLDFWEKRFQGALKNWNEVEQKRESIHQGHLQKAKDISRMLFLQKQDLCKRFRLQEKKDKMRSKEEARVGRILSKKYAD